MSQIAISPPAAGTGVFNVTPPATNTNQTLTLPDATGTLLSIDSAGAVSNSSGVVNLGAGQVYKDASGNVGVGSTSPTEKLHVAGNMRTTGSIRTGVYTVSTLPTGVQGMRAMVTDALAPAFLALAVGGGAVVAPVFFNGTQWVAA